MIFFDLKQLIGKKITEVTTKEGFKDCILFKFEDGSELLGYLTYAILKDDPKKDWIELINDLENKVEKLEFKTQNELSKDGIYMIGLK